MSGPTYVSNGGEAEASGTAVTVNVPTGVANGDLLIAIVNAIHQSAAFPAQSGWTLALDYQSSYPTHLAIYYRYASSEPASYTFSSGTGCTYMGAYILRVTGAVTSGNPFDAIGAGSDIPVSASATAASITTASANTLLFQFAGSQDGSAAVTAFPSGFTGVQSSIMAFAYESFAGPGATGSETMTYSTAVVGATVLGAIKGPPVTALAATPSDTTAASGTITTAFLLWQAVQLDACQRRIISQPIKLADAGDLAIRFGYPRGEPCGTVISIFPLVVGSNGSFTITDGGNVIFTIAAANIVAGAPIPVGITCMSDITVSQVPTGGEYGVLWEGVYVADPTVW